MVYNWKEGTRLRADAQKVGEELEEIKERDAKTVLDVARRNKRSELHKCFEWDDMKAGEQYRLDQARRIMRIIVTDVECLIHGKPQSVMIRAFESVRKIEDDGEPSRSMVYVKTLTALKDENYREQIIGDLEATIREAETTAEKYSFLVPQFRKTSEKLKEARETVRA